MPKRAPTHKPARASGRRHGAHRDKVADRERGTAAERGYDYRWQRLRAVYLRHNPLCEHCAAHGKTVPAQDVDHIEPISERSDLRLVWSNLRALCRRCHNRVTHGGKPAVGVDGFPVES